MTLTEQIEAAGKQPLDLEVLSRAQSISFDLASIEHKTGHSRTVEGIYTLLLRIRDLEKQVEQERFIPCNERVSDIGMLVLVITTDGEICRAAYSGLLHMFYTVDFVRRTVTATHWKPIKLPV